VRDALTAHFRKVIDNDPRFAPVAASMKDSGFELLDQLIAIGRDADVEAVNA